MLKISENKNIRAFCAAIGFLTVIRLGEQSNEEDLGRSAAFFPLVGILIGLVVALADFLFLSRLFPPSVESVLVTGLLVSVSGGLHADGLADTADGFLSSRPKEKIFAIMKDSSVGTMGVLALLGILGAKAAALSHLSGSLRFCALLCAPLAGRTALLLMMVRLPHAKTQSLANVFSGYLTRKHVAGAATLLAVAGLVFGGAKGLGAAIASLVAVWVFGSWCRTKIGGRTGDTLGAACEISEAAVLVFASML